MLLWKGYEAFEMVLKDSFPGSLIKSKAEYSQAKYYSQLYTERWSWAWRDLLTYTPSTAGGVTKIVNDELGGSVLLEISHQGIRTLTSRSFHHKKLEIVSTQEMPSSWYPGELSSFKEDLYLRQKRTVGWYVPTRFNFCPKHE